MSKIAMSLEIFYLCLKLLFLKLLCLKHPLSPTGGDHLSGSSSPTPRRPAVEVRASPCSPTVPSAVPSYPSGGALRCPSYLVRERPARIRARISTTAAHTAQLPQRGQEPYLRRRIGATRRGRPHRQAEDGAQRRWTLTRIFGSLLASVLAPSARLR